MAGRNGQRPAWISAEGAGADDGGGNPLVGYVRVSTADQAENGAGLYLLRRVPDATQAHQRCKA